MLLQKFYLLFKGARKKLAQTVAYSRILEGGMERRTDGAGLVFLSTYLKNDVSTGSGPIRMLRATLASPL
jgi:hypothetical protein